MKSIKVNASKNYEVCIGSGIIYTSDYLKEKLYGKTATIVSDDTVAGFYMQKLEDILKKLNVKILKYVFPHGEQSKNLSIYSKLEETMCLGKMTRSDVVLALGGGVVGDMAGFAAATYQRGIEFIQLPTTLLAAVDSSVGGKTGVDLDAGKNQVGVFYQPSHVLCDTDMLSTLPDIEYRNGCAEIIKYAMIGNKELFESIKKTKVSDQFERVISTCVSMKKDFVEKDEFDTGERMLLNFGHTVGHAVETCSGYEIPHGQAVAIGMAVITKAAVNLGYCEKEVYDGLVDLLKQYGLPTETSFSVGALSEAMKNDKKGKGDSITFVVPEIIGRCRLEKVSKDRISEWLEAGGVK